MVFWKKLLLMASAQDGLRHSTLPHESCVPAFIAVRAELPAAVRRAAPGGHAGRRDGARDPPAAHHRLRCCGDGAGTAHPGDEPRPPPPGMAALRPPPHLPRA